MLNVTMYTKENCPLCDEAELLLKDLQQELSFSYSKVDIYQNEELLEQYQLMIPVISINGETADFGQVSKKTS